MPKLAIYVPKQEMKKIDRYRKKLNFSKIFMRALSREISELSRGQDVSQDQVVAAAAHYRRQLADDQDQMREVGYQLGSDDVLACRLEPGVIRRLVSAASQDGGPDPSEIMSELMPDDLARLEESGREQGYDENTLPVWRRYAFEGYVEGVAAAWQQVCRAMAQS